VSLDNHNLREQALQTTPEVVEVLFWRMEDALYSGNRDLAQAILIDFAYIAKYNKLLLARHLRPRYIQRLKEINNELNGTPNSRNVEPVEIRQAVPASELQFGKESDLRDYLSLHPEALAPIGSFDLIRTAIPVEEGYEIDIVAENEKLAYIIELKITKADHKVCSQIRKYLFYYYRQCRYDWYRDLQGVVVANGFDPWCINELRRDGIWCFLVYSSTTGPVLRKLE
jgi:hypothetical protein